MRVMRTACHAYVVMDWTDGSMPTIVIEEHCQPLALYLRGEGLELCEDRGVCVLQQETWASEVLVLSGCG